MGTKPPILRADAEEAEERDDADAGTQLKKFISDATMAMDSIAKRMDSMEERFSKKDSEEKEAKPDAKKDSKSDAVADAEACEDTEDKKEEKEDSTVIYRGQKAPNPNKKSDAEAEVPAKEEMKADKKKDSMDEKKEREDAKADARADSASDERLKRLEAALGDVVTAMPKKRSDDDYHAMCDVQARADEVYSALGQRSAPRFLDGEDSLGYRRRLVRDLKKHSPDWKDVNIHAIADESAFTVMERRVYADAMDVARSPVSAEVGTLRAVTRRSGGHEITEYVGEPKTWMDSFAGPVRTYATSITNGTQR